MIGVLLAKVLTRRAYELINRGDLASYMAYWSKAAKYTYPGNLSVSGTRTGSAEIEAWFRHFFEAIPTRTFRVISVSVSNIFDFLGNNVIAVQWDNRPVNRRGEEFFIRGTSIVTIRWGKTTDSITYIFDYMQLSLLWGEEAAH